MTDKNSTTEVYTVPIIVGFLFGIICLIIYFTYFRGASAIEAAEGVAEAATGAAEAMTDVVTGFEAPLQMDAIPSLTDAAAPVLEI